MNGAPSEKERREVYLDNSATTALSPVAAAAVRDAYAVYGNPSSPHAAGVAAAKLLADSRAKLLRAAAGGDIPPAGEIAVFTGSGSEANNLAIAGAGLKKRHFDSNRIIITDSEHPSVANTASRLAGFGFETAEIPTRGGVIDRDALRSELKRGAAIVSLMLVNNETGARYDIEDIAAEVRKLAPSAFLHCDAVQGFTRTALPLSCVDAVSVSAHKIHGPKGVGCLFVSPSVISKKLLSPVIFGGGQESGLRSGTENVPGIAGFAAAAAEAAENAVTDGKRLSELNSELICGVTAAGARANLPPRRVDHILSVTLPGIRSQTMLNFLSDRGIYISAGSACSSKDRKISRALKAFGLPDDEAECTVRVSLSAYNTEEDVSDFIAAVKAGISSLLRMRVKHRWF